MIELNKESLAWLVTSLSREVHSEKFKQLQKSGSSSVEDVVNAPLAGEDEDEDEDDDPPIHQSDEGLAHWHHLVRF